VIYVVEVNINTIWIDESAYLQRSGQHQR
jgi:hypothetical protein